ncbi:MAG: hypothetical protein IJE10_01430 [Clostridia bacterium]|nr:hypothetical protein [Clostridia bacterium]
MKQVLYTPQGLWKFYHDEKKGICFYAPKSTTPMLLFEKGCADFDTACDEKGNLFLISQDDKNNLYLFYYDKKRWNRQCILESKSVVPYDKNFRLFCTNGWVHAFYNIRHEAQYLLVHHMLNENTKPEVIESRSYPFCYAVTQDSKQNIHVFYEKSGLMQKTFFWQNKAWVEPKLLTEINGDLISLQGIFDENDAMHLVYSRRNKQEYSVCYLSERGTQTLLSGLENAPEPIILQFKEYHILFRMAGRLLQSSAIRPEEGFLKPQYYFPGSFNPHSLFRIKTSQTLRRHHIFVDTIYGTEARPDRFDATLIGEALNAIDFALPEKPVEQESDLTQYMQEVSDFQKEEQKETVYDSPAPEVTPLDSKLDAFEARISALENQFKKADS